jgi:hypothetical protein
MSRKTEPLAGPVEVDPHPVRQLASRRLRKTLCLAVPALALAMLVITAVPAQVWRAPTNDAVYTGFDPNLDFTQTAGSGTVRVSRDSIDMTAPSSVNLATTLLPKLNASTDVVVQDAGDATQPVRVGLWSPWTETGQFIVFGPAPQNVITAQTLVKGKNGPTLLTGVVSATKDLGRYQLGQPYRVAVVLDKTAGTITFRVTGADGTNAVTSVPTAVFGNVQVSLNVSASPEGGTSHVVLSNFTLTLPHQRIWASKADDPRLTAILVTLALAGLLLLVIAAITRLPRGGLAWVGRGLRSRVPRIRRGPVPFAVAGAIAFYLVGNGLLFMLGGQPFDMGDEKLYAYVARAYGPAQLYYLPNVVTMSWIWGGIPYIESAFPYEPTSAYLHTAIGWLNSILFAGGGTFSPRALSVEYLTKAVNVLFGLADTGLIYLLSRHIGLSKRWSVTTGALFLFNPAVWFSMSVWGQTHVFSLFLVLSAVWLAEKQHVTGAWLLLAAACLTRPQMLVFGLLLGIVFLRKFTWRQNVAALSWTVIVVFILLTPFTLATSASLPVDVMLHNLNVQEGGGNVAILTTVSQDSYSIWPLVTYAVRGASSLSRAFTPSSDLLIGSLTYARVSQVLTVSAMLVVAGTLVFRKRATDGAGAYIPFVALGIASFLMLLTGIVSTHFLLALPFLLLCRKWMSAQAFFFVIAIWSITTFVPMYGDMGVVMSSQDYPLLARAHNQVTQFFVSLYSADRFITVAVVANICAVIWLATFAFRSAPSVREGC